jgi:fatty acid desaturase
MDVALTVLLVVVILSIPPLITGLLMWRFGFHWWTPVVFALMLVIVVFSFFRKSDDREEEDLPDVAGPPVGRNWA